MRNVFITRNIPYSGFHSTQCFHHNQYPEVLADCLRTSLHKAIIINDSLLLSLYIFKRLLPYIIKTHQFPYQLHIRQFFCCESTLYPFFKTYVNILTHCFLFLKTHHPCYTKYISRFQHILLQKEASSSC